MVRVSKNALLSALLFRLFISNPSSALSVDSTELLLPPKLLRGSPGRSKSGPQLPKEEAFHSLLEHKSFILNAAATPGVTAVLSKYGLQYAKEVVVTQILQELIPLAIPDLDLSLPTPFGHVAVNLSDTVLWNATVPTSKLYLDPSSQTVTVYAGDIDANITSAWSFALGHILADQGNATITVSGLHVVAVGNLTEVNGGLMVHVEEVQCVIENIQILLNSPYSWIYNWLEGRLPNHLRSAVESEIEWSVGMFVDELNDFLQSLPRSLTVDCLSAVNVTVPSNPGIEAEGVVLSCEGSFQEAQGNCSRRSTVLTDTENLVSFVFDGEGREGPPGKGDWMMMMFPEDFEWEEEGRDGEESGQRVRGGEERSVMRMVRDVEEPIGGRCDRGTKMLDLRVSEDVLNSALRVYYETDTLSLTVRSLPSTFPFQLNTKSWRFVLPSLYKQYPNRDLELACVASSQPSIALSSTQGIIAAAKAAFFLRVLLDEGPKDVLCIDIGLEMSAVASLRENNLTAVAHLSTLSVHIRWSTVGTISQTLLEGITLTLTKLVVIPLLNYRLGIGFPLPSIPGVLFTNSTVGYEDKALQVCTDLMYTGGIFTSTMNDRTINVR